MENSLVRAWFLILPVLVVAWAAGCSEPGALPAEGPDADTDVQQDLSPPTDTPAPDGDVSCACVREPSDAAHRELACLCSGSNPIAACGDTLSTFRTSPNCGSFIGLQRRTGCGKVTYWGTWGYGGQSSTFDATTGALVGVLQAGDAVWGACGTHLYHYGDVNEDCATVETCQVCGNVNPGSAPACN